MDLQPGSERRDPRSILKYVITILTSCSADPTTDHETNRRSIIELAYLLSGGLFHSYHNWA